MKNLYLFLLLFVLSVLPIYSFGQNGLNADFFDGSNFNRLVAKRVVPNIDMYWNEVPPVPGINPHECSIRWTGMLRAPKTGVYTFSARVDDGIRVWVGGVKVIDDWRLNDVGVFAGQVKLEEGQEYNLKVEYFNALIEGEVTLLWDIPDADKEWGALLQGNKAVVIEPSYFSHKQIDHKALIDSAPNSATTDKVVAEQSPLPEPAPIIPATKKVVALDTLERYIPKNILFERAKSIILPGSFPALDSLAGFLLRNPNLKTKIEGHTDYAGDAYKNVILSQNRADAVAQYLIEKGVDESRLTAKGYGGSEPLVKSDGRKYHPENRRVEFVIE